jgi:hypothetical protein
MLVQSAPAFLHALPRNSSASDILDPLRVLLELSAIELLRDLRSLSAEQLCQSIRSFAVVRFRDTGVFAGLQQANVEKIRLGQCTPKQLAISLHSLVKARMLEHCTCKVAAQMIRSDMLAFHVCDVAISLWTFARLQHRQKALVEEVQESVKRRGVLASLVP